MEELSHREPQRITQRTTEIYTQNNARVLIMNKKR
jgi:hypothetical protein